MADDALRSDPRSDHLATTQLYSKLEAHKPVKHTPQAASSSAPITAKKADDSDDMWDNVPI